MNEGTQQTITPTIVQEGEGPTDVVFTDLSTLDGDLAATLETSLPDKGAYDKMIQLGLTPDQALKITCIMLLIWKNNVSKTALSQTLRVVLPAPGATPPVTPA